MLLVIALISALTLMVASVLSAAQRRQRRRINVLRGQVHELRRELQTPEERQAEDRRRWWVEMQKRIIQGLFGPDGT